MSDSKYQEREVAWYRRHGRFANTRIRRDGHGEEYVIGDESWNGVKPRPPEWVERTMKEACESKP